MPLDVSYTPLQVPSASMGDNLKTHGVLQQRVVQGRADAHLEEFNIQGFTIIPSVITSDTLSSARLSIDEILAQQQLEFSNSTDQDLSSINDQNVVRALLAFDPLFLDEFILNDVTLDLIREILGHAFVLHSQVATVNLPGSDLYQAAWHRELQYQHFTSSRPLAVQTIWCIDTFSSETGGTLVLPGSHLHEELPSDEFVSSHEFQVEMQPGDVLLMNSMIFHRAGSNTCSHPRRLLTNTFTLPFIGQQIDFSQLVDDSLAKDDFLAGLLGFKWGPESSPLSWRLKKFHSAMTAIDENR